MPQSLSVVQMFLFVFLVLFFAKALIRNIEIMLFRLQSEIQFPLLRIKSNIFLYVRLEIVKFCILLCNIHIF